MTEIKLVEDITTATIGMKEAAARQVAACDRMLDLLAEWNAQIEKAMEGMRLEAEQEDRDRQEAVDYANSIAKTIN